MKSPVRNVILLKDLLGHTSISTSLEYIETNCEQLRSCLDEHFVDNHYKYLDVTKIFYNLFKNIIEIIDSIIH